MIDRQENKQQSIKFRRAIIFQLSYKQIVTKHTQLIAAYLAGSKVDVHRQSQYPELHWCLQIT